MEDGFEGAPEVSEGAVDSDPMFGDAELDTNVEPESTVPKYKVVIDGEELEVDEDELRNGYQRQADYTRKTQALSAEKQSLATAAALAQALERDPRGTLDALTSYYGLNAAPDGGDDDELVTPEAQALREIQAWKSQQEERQRVAEVQSEAQHAISKHELGVGINDLVAFAMTAQIGSLDTAARLLKAEMGVQAKAQDTAVRTDAKRAAQVVEGGTSRSSAARSTHVDKPSLREAWLMAQAEHS